LSQERTATIVTVLWNPEYVKMQHNACNVQVRPNGKSVPRMLQAGVILSDYATLMVEILKDNARPEAGQVYGAMDMGLGLACWPDRPGLGKK
jgi:hypothetical protein